MSRAFRFGVVAAPQGPGAAWSARARRIADLGYSTLLTPDNLNMHSPMLALAAAAEAAPTLRVCPFVLAAPLRPARTIAWEAHTLTALTGGRFDLGIGTGRPDARAEAERLGLPWGSWADRMAHVQEAIAALREREVGEAGGARGGGGDGGSGTGVGAGPRGAGGGGAAGAGVDGPLRTPVLMAASGPKALAVAAAEADVVMLAARPDTPRPEVRRMASDLRDQASGRELEIGMNLFVVGDEIPPWAAQWAGPNAAEALRDPDTLVVLRGTADQMAAELERRREELGLSYVAVSEAFADALAPVVERLTGK